MTDAHRGPEGSPDAAASARPALRALAASRALAAAGQQDMVWGHAAVRDPDGRGAWLKRSGLGLNELVVDDIHLVGWDGDLLQGRGRPHVESFIHLCAMRARPDVQVSVHTHPPAVNAFAALEQPLRALSHEGVLFARPQVPRSPLSGDLISTQELGDALADSLGEAPACLMPRHGLLTVGINEAEAVMHAVLLESACAIHLRAAAAGVIRSYSDEEELMSKRQHVWPPTQVQAGYDYLLRQWESRGRR